MTNLDEAQKKQVAKWIEEGLKLSDIQSKIGQEFGLAMTYMEVRFLVDDLGVKLKDQPEEKPAPPPPPAAGPGPLNKPGDIPRPGGVKVAVDQVMRPGALVSGKVTFSDGKQAEWYLDQMGRLGVIPREDGYKPSQDDIADFQAELQRELQRQGF